MRSMENLIKNIESHPALNNAFYDLWMNEILSEKQISIFAFNYWFFSNNFPKSLSSLIYHTTDPVIRFEYTKTLYSEMGEGDINRIHSLLFEKFYSDLSVHLNKKNSDTMEKLKRDLLPLGNTVAFIEGQLSLYANNHAIAVGAQLALEWQAYSMVAKLYEGARNYMALWPNVISFHESCEFFYVHIGSAEKEHKVESLNVAKIIARNDKTYEDIEYGFNTHLTLIENFWLGLAEEIRKYSP